MWNYWKGGAAPLSHTSIRRSASISLDLRKRLSGALQEYEGWDGGSGKLFSRNISRIFVKSRGQSLREEYCRGAKRSRIHSILNYDEYDEKYLKVESRGYPPGKKWWVFTGCDLKKAWKIPSKMTSVGFPGNDKSNMRGWHLTEHTAERILGWEGTGVASLHSSYKGTAHESQQRPSDGQKSQFPLSETLNSTSNVSHISHQVKGLPINADVHFRYCLPHVAWECHISLGIHRVAKVSAFPLEQGIFREVRPRRQPNLSPWLSIFLVDWSSSWLISTGPVPMGNPPTPTTVSDLTDLMVSKALFNSVNKHFLVKGNISWR